MINLLDKSQFKAIGIYVIYNSNNNKYYVGNSKELVRRYYHHLTTLRSNKHKNYKLQLDYNNTVDKNVFSYSCIEVLNNTEILLEKEQEWVNFFNSYNDDYGYNINPSTTLISQSLPSDVIAKRRQTFLKTLEEKRKDPEFKGYNTKPNKTSFQVGIKVWNEGIKMSEEQRSKLRVPKTYNSEEERLKRLENVKLTKENKLPVVYIYDLNNNFLQKFNNCWEIEKYSQSNEFKLPIISGVKENKNYLAIQKIKECYNGIRLSYKGLKFSLLPLHQEIDVEKLDNIGENPNILILLG